MSLNKKFNVAFDPFIKVRWLDGSRGRVSIMDAFTRSREIAAIESEWPYADVAVYRLLTTILRRVAAPKTTLEWVKLLVDGLPIKEIVAYLEQFRDLFELFHATRPFMQYPIGFDVDMTEEYGPTSMSKCVPFMATGLNPIFFDRRRCGAGTDDFGDGIDDDHGWPVDPADAALLLMSLQSWALAGGNNHPVGTLRRGPMLGRSTIINWITGKNLAETIALNTLSDETEPMSSCDAPCWEQELVHVTTDTYMRDPLGPLDFGTFLSRRANLVLRDDGKVAKIVVRIGFAIPDVEDNTDPKKAAKNAAAKESGKKGAPRIMVVRMHPWAAYGRSSRGDVVPASADALSGSLWRNADLILGMRTGSRPPLQLVQLATAISSGTLAAPSGLRVWGIAPTTDTKCNRIETSHVEQFELPPAWPGHLPALRSALDFARLKTAEAAALARKIVSDSMHFYPPEPKKEDIQKAFDGYYVEEAMKLRLNASTPILQRVALGDESASKSWSKAVFSAYRETMSEFQRRLPAHAGSFKAVAINTQEEDS